MKAIVQQAQEFAILNHGDQKYGQRPYEYHLQKVVNVLGRFSLDHEILVCSAWLHDVIEDTPCSFEEVEAVFGFDVADIVSRVSYVEGTDKQEILKRTYARIRGREESVLVKLADRIANVEEGVLNRGCCFKKYERQHQGFREALYRKGEADTLWEHLEGLLSASRAYRKC